MRKRQEGQQVETIFGKTIRDELNNILDEKVNIDKDEFKMALKDLKNNKVPGIYEEQADINRITSTLIMAE